MDFNMTELSNGDLKISFDESDREGIVEMVDEGYSDFSILLEGTEHYFVNGGYHPFDSGLANPFVGLTEATGIAQSLNFDDDGNATIEGDFWYDTNYMLKSFIEEMLSNGHVIFRKAS